MILILLGLASCQNPEITEKDTPTSGKTSIAADATLQLPVESEIKAFERIYDKAEIACRYGSEAEIFQALLRDSVSAVIAARELSSDEKAHFDRKGIVPRYVYIGADAIVLLVNRNNPDSLLRFEELRAIANGKINAWEDLESNSHRGKIDLVFDQEGSSTVTSFMRLLGVKKLPPNAYAMNSGNRVLEYVMRNPQAIGVIGMSWVSDLSDAARAQLGEHVTIACLRPERYPKDRYFKPDQVNISEGKYPLFRRLHLINCEGKNGLVSGLATYIASQKGQLILLKSGILPATLPQRTVHSN
ncbi:MAG: substrate-binding domain-containing protein [Saprospiraceae bacterium]|nr:substrate-binding domain-containing protein [Saprospiraceae bacterium]